LGIDGIGRNGCGKSGVDNVEISQEVVMNRDNMAIDAAIDGQGIVLARTTLASWDWLNGRLVTPLTNALKVAKTYWVVSPKATAERPKIVTFRAWLHAAIAADERLLLRLRKAD
jgi:LysR family transcriptional regulator, glycine cleavage system transcriptional activator